MNADDEQPAEPGKRPESLAAKRGSGGAVTREDRLKVALKANMARRKAQARARSGDEQDKGQGQ